MNINRKSPFLQRSGQFAPKNSGRRGRPPPTILHVRKLHEFPFMWCKNVSRTFVHFVTIHACDGWTDRRTALRSPRPRLHAMQRGKNCIRCISTNNTVSKKHISWCHISPLLCNPTIRCHDENGCHVRLKSSVEERETFNVEHMNFVNK